MHKGPADDVRALILAIGGCATLDIAPAPTGRGVARVRTRCGHLPSRADASAAVHFDAAVARSVADGTVDGMLIRSKGVT
ncbi:MAG: hypothetical protein L0K86_01070 [Actinomycetia bacterium]|nr:hypothetical protein [Actinomycetes bacterium]